MALYEVVEMDKVVCDDEVELCLLEELVELGF